MNKKHRNETEGDLGPIPKVPSLPPEDDIKKTTPQREWEIKKLQEQFGLSRELAERMVDESRGSG